MKFIRRLLLLLLILTFLLFGLIGICAYNPDAAGIMADVLGINPVKKNPVVEQYKPMEPGNIGEIPNLPEEVPTDYELMQEPDEESISEGNDTPILDTTTPFDTEDMAIVPGINDDMAGYQEGDTVLRIPEAVAEKTGYQQINGQTSAVGEVEAQDIISNVGPGNTGDDVNFDPEFYPYYGMLDETGKKLYRQMYANTNELNNKFSPIVQIGENGLRNVFQAVYNDHPEFFWMDSGYSGKVSNSGQVLEIDIKYNETANDIDNSKNRFNNAVKQYMSYVPASGTDFDKEAKIHDLLVQNIEYNLRAPMNQSAYSALVNGETVCAGYARAMQYLMQKLEIPTYYCTGYAGEAHAWNIVELDNEFYNADATWADTEPVNYDYFNKSDYDYSDSHRREDLSVYLPPCNGSKYSDILKTDKNYGLPSVDDVGITSDQIMSTIEEYIEDCRESIEQKGRGNYVFVNAVDGDELFERVDELYRSQEYKTAYLEDAMRTVGATNCQMSLEIQPLQYNKYYIMHKISIK